MPHHRLMIRAVLTSAPLLAVAIILCSTTGQVPTAFAATGPALTVNATTGNHPISPYIYGMNFADPALMDELNLPINRWGGNTTTRYNYTNNIANHASDWYFENIVQDQSADEFITQNNTYGTDTIITIPTIGYVANDDHVHANHPGEPPERGCGFSITTYGAQTGNDSQWFPDCGNGISPGGGFIIGNDPYDTSEDAPPGFAEAWVNTLEATYGNATTANGVRFYALDNEPDLWFETHRDVHPEGAGYDEMYERGRDYAIAIKAADPTAQVLGPVAWGWWGYFYSANDVAEHEDWWNNSAASNPDKFAHGNVDFLEWYLQQMAAYDATGSNPRLLDYMDVHFYTQVTGVSLSPAGNSTTQARRLRSTRSLWDPAYNESVDGSWIQDEVMLIPRMRDIIDDNYPGTKLAITEYNWGGLEHINGALAQADVLGIFGREGVDMATIWGPPGPNQPGAYAFRMYLNYDGAGSTFGDTSISASSGDQGKVSIYGSQDSGTGDLKLMIINKTGSTQTSALTISNFTPDCTADVYRYSSNPNLNTIVHSTQAVSGTGFTANYPANSITLVVIPEGPCGGGSGELIANGSFETDGNGDSVPDGWTAKNMQINTNDDIVCGPFSAGACSFTILGNGKGKTLIQQINVPGAATDTFTLSFDTQGTSVPNKGNYLVDVKFYYTNGTKKSFKLKVVAPFPGTFTHYSLPITITRPYNRIDVTVQYSKASGRVWFDAMSLLKN
jgi:hypothetical protein